MATTTITRKSIIGSNGFIAFLFLCILVFSLVNLIEFIRILRADEEDYYEFNRTLIIFLIVGNTIILAVSLIYMIIFIKAIIRVESIDFYDIIQQFRLPGLDAYKKALEIKEAKRPELVAIPELVKRVERIGPKIIEKVSTCPIDAKPALPALAEKPLQITIKDLRPTGEKNKGLAFKKVETSLDLQTLRKEYFDRSKLLTR